MKKEYIFKRENGSKVRLHVEFLILSSREFLYRISVYICKPNKRKFLKIDITDNIYIL